MLLSKTARSSTLKLALIYVALFGTAIFGLLAYVYWSSISYVRNNLDRAALAERMLLMQTYDAGGRRGLIALIERRIGDERLAGWYYELSDPSFMPLAGNLPRWPKGTPAAMGTGAGWSDLSEVETAPRPSTQPRLWATYRTLGNGDHLLLARQAARADGFAAETTAALTSAGGLFLVLAAAAGISTARRSVARIEAINATSREIMPQRARQADPAARQRRRVG